MVGGLDRRSPSRWRLEFRFVLSVFSLKRREGAREGGKQRLSNHPRIRSQCCGVAVLCVPSALWHECFAGLLWFVLSFSEVFVRRVSGSFGRISGLWRASHARKAESSMDTVPGSIARTSGEYTHDEQSNRNRIPPLTWHQAGINNISSVVFFLLL